MKIRRRRPETEGVAEQAMGRTQGSFVSPAQAANAAAAPWQALASGAKAVGDIASGIQRRREAQLAADDDIQFKATTAELTAREKLLAQEASEMSARGEDGESFYREQMQSLEENMRKSLQGLKSEDYRESALKAYEANTPVRALALETQATGLAEASTVARGNNLRQGLETAAQEVDKSQRAPIRQRQIMLVESMRGVIGDEQANEQIAAIQETMRTERLDVVANDYYALRQAGDEDAANQMQSDIANGEGQYAELDEEDREYLMAQVEKEADRYDAAVKRQEAELNSQGKVTLARDKNDITIGRMTLEDIEREGPSRYGVGADAELRYEQARAAAIQKQQSAQTLSMDVDIFGRPRDTQTNRRAMDGELAAQMAIWGEENNVDVNTIEGQLEAMRAVGPEVIGQNGVVPDAIVGALTGADNPAQLGFAAELLRDIRANDPTTEVDLHLPSERENLLDDILFYSNGFQNDDGSYMSLEDAANYVLRMRNESTPEQRMQWIERAEQTITANSSSWFEDDVSEVYGADWFDMQSEPENWEQMEGEMKGVWLRALQDGLEAGRPESTARQTAQRIVRNMYQRTNGLNVDDDGNPIEEVVPYAPKPSTISTTDKRGQVSVEVTNAPNRKLMLMGARNAVAENGAPATYINDAGDRVTADFASLDENRLVLRPARNRNEADAFGTMEVFYRTDGGQEAELLVDGNRIAITPDEDDEKLLRALSDEDKATRKVQEIEAEIQAAEAPAGAMASRAGLGFRPRSVTGEQRLAEARRRQEEARAAREAAQAEIGFN